MSTLSSLTGEGRAGGPLKLRLSGEVLGNTAIYQYSALNQRVRIDEGGNAEGFIYNQNAQRVSVWNVKNGVQMQGETYWGREPVEYTYTGHATYFHGDWLGTNRVQTPPAGMNSCSAYPTWPAN